eukprot:m.182084 g.182084  ORF g.182084 m.182084 type:complete len:1404 (-) comp17455_c0_seq3:254-4465(-)
MSGRRTAENTMKVTQRRLFDFLSTRAGICLCTAGLLLVVISAISFSHAIYVNHAAPAGVWTTDNIAGRSFRDRMCLPEPIDVVYTWVNGSDPLLIEQLDELKARLKAEDELRKQLERNRTLEEKARQQLERNGTGLVNVSSTVASSGNTTTTVPTTPLPKLVDLRDNILLDPRALTVHGLRDTKLDIGKRSTPLREALLQHCGRMSEVTLDYLEIVGVAVFEEDVAPLCLNKTIAFHGANLTFQPAFFVGDATYDGVKRLPDEYGLGEGLYFLTTPVRAVFLSDIPEDLPEPLLQSLLAPYGNVSYMSRNVSKGVAVVSFADRFSAIDCLLAKTLKVHRSNDSSSDDKWLAGHLPVPTRNTTTSSTTTTTAKGGKSGSSKDGKSTPETSTTSTSSKKFKRRGLLSSSKSNTTNGADTSSTTSAAATTTTTLHPNELANHEIVISPLVRCGEVPLLPSLHWFANGTYLDDGSDRPKEQEESSKSRFQDNSELQYSLRSVEKNAPWIRHIFIVTNGQIPSWLNLDHPRLTLVAHSDIFENKTHLPTFSSPAIEAHLHKIPGLSKKFIYLNDDVMFGTEVWPDDFYTHAKGQKVFLAWPVPNCEDGCPSNWIGDKYCDLACNTTNCDFDGGDCLNRTGPGAAAGFQGGGGGGHGFFSNNFGDYCNQGCSDTWMGDKYCDRACDTEACGFDTGDCGMNKVFATVKGFKVEENTTVIHQDVAVNGSYPVAVYFNLSAVCPPNSSVTEASYESPDVRAAVISQPHKVMMMVLRYNINATIIPVTIKLKLVNQSESFIHFNVSVCTLKIEPPPETTQPESRRNASAAANGTDTAASTEITKGKGQLDASSSTTAATTTTTTTSTTKSRSRRRSRDPSDLPNVPAGMTFNASVHAALQALDADLAAGEVTAKGYAVYKWEILGPLLAAHGNGNGNNSISQHEEDEEEEGEEEEVEVEVGDKDSDKRKNLRRRVLGLTPDSVAADDWDVAMGVRWPKAPALGHGVDQAMASQSSSNSNLQTPVRQPFAADDVAAASAKTRYLGFLPWERLGFFEPIEDNSAAESLSHQRRQLKDTFGDSLKHVNNLYNKKFGYTPRKVIAHMPHMIDRDIMYELEHTFPKEWDATSSHQLRHGKDMQYAFAYFYFLIHQKLDFNLTEEFNRLDTDRDGLLSVNELRTFVTRVYDIPTSADTWNTFEGILLNCSSLQPPLEKLGVGVGPDEVEVWVTEQLVRNCSALLKLVEKMAGTRTKYKHQLETDEKDVAFKMIRNNATEVAKQLDAVRRAPQKFVCLNDNVDHRLESAQQVVKALIDFYESFFPIRSAFELPEGYRNRFGRIEELREWQRSREATRWWSTALLIAVLSLCLAYIMRGKLFAAYRAVVRPRYTSTVVATGGVGSPSSTSSQYHHRSWTEE